MHPSAVMEALMLQSGRWNNFDQELILADLYPRTNVSVAEFF